jgi:hypothetical protein
MDKFTTLTGVAAPPPLPNLDTDQAHRAGAMAVPGNPLPA